MQKKESRELGGKIVAFLKRNIYYVLMILCVLAITAVVTTVAVLNSGGSDVEADGKLPPVVKPEDSDDKPSVEEKFIVTMPVVGGVIGREYYEEGEYDATLGEYESHDGVDILATVGQDIMAAFDGTVVDVETDGYRGGSVTIEHTQGYTTVFELVGDVAVKVGDKVTEDTVIGKVATFSFESAGAPHIHYEVLKDGKQIDPVDVIADSDK